MSVIMQEARPEHYDQILKLVQKYLDPEGDEVRNRHLFSYSWISMPGFEKTTPGYVLLADNRVVGYTGYIVSKRNINGQAIDWITGTTSAIEPEYRTFFLKLLTPLSRRDAFRIVYDPRDNVEKIVTCRAYNFQLFDGITNIFPTFLPSLRNDGVKLQLDTEIARQFASDSEKDLIDDNCRYIAEAAKVSTPEGDFIIIYRKFRLCFKGIVKLSITFSEILYANDRALLKKYIGGIVRQMLLKGKVPFLLCPSRFLEGAKIPPAFHKEFKSFCAGGEKFNIDLNEIDDLYSEKTVIDFYNKPKSVYIGKLISRKDPLAID